MPLIGRKRVKKLLDSSYTILNDNLRGVYLAGLTNVVQGTPVDTGRARNNWFLSVGHPSDSITTSKAKGLGAIRSLRTMPKRVINKKLYYTNNLPYIDALEYSGHSQQSPRGWVRTTLIKMQNKIRSL